MYVYSKEEIHEKRNRRGDREVWGVPGLVGRPMTTKMGLPNTCLIKARLLTILLFLTILFLSQYRALSLPTFFHLNDRDLPELEFRNPDLDVPAREPQNIFFLRFHLNERKLTGGQSTEVVIVSDSTGFLNTT